MSSSPAEKKPKAKKKAAQSSSAPADDFVSVARRLGADESKERFEAKLKKIATPPKKADSTVLRIFPIILLALAHAVQKSHLQNIIPRDCAKSFLQKSLECWHQNRPADAGSIGGEVRDGKVGPFAEYLVYCDTRDGWRAWLIWPGSDKITGPTGIADGPAPPKK